MRNDASYGDVTYVLQPVKPCRGIAIRFTLVMLGDEFAIEDRETGKVDRFAIKPGQVDWDEPSDCVHRGVNAGTEPYEETAVFFLDDPNDDPQPTEG